MVEWGGGDDDDSFVANLFVVENVSWNWISITRYVVTAPTIWKISHITLQQWSVSTQIRNVPRTITRQISRASQYRVIEKDGRDLKPL